MQLPRQAFVDGFMFTAVDDDDDEDEGSSYNRGSRDDDSPAQAAIFLPEAILAFVEGMPLL